MFVHIFPMFVWSDITGANIKCKQWVFFYIGIVVCQPILLSIPLFISFRKLSYKNRLAVRVFQLSFNTSSFIPVLSFSTVILAPIMKPNWLSGLFLLYIWYRWMDHGRFGVPVEARKTSANCAKENESAPVLAREIRVRLLREQYNYRWTNLSQ